MPTRVPFTFRKTASTPPPPSATETVPVWIPDFGPPLNNAPVIEEITGAVSSSTTSLKLLANTYAPQDGPQRG